MITTDLDRFLALARACAPDFGPATARAAFLVTPEGFARAEESAQDNRYMAAADGYHGEAALAEHRALQRALSADLPV
ncbi:MAG: amidinotransferase, partial [Burkholderiaceae bacterium]